ncbi:hypothetical protein EDP1_4011 [Pseudomonas putida S610]|nr:hypothetical protein EDP1_4011 [Pseudomonas putida S610]
MSGSNRFKNSLLRHPYHTILQLERCTPLPAGLTVHTAAKRLRPSVSYCSGAPWVLRPKNYVSMSSGPH